MSVATPEKLASAASAEGMPERPALKRSLGLSMATALVIGNMVGSGVFGLPASLATIQTAEQQPLTAAGR